MSNTVSVKAGLDVTLHQFVLAEVCVKHNPVERCCTLLDVIDRVILFRSKCTCCTVQPKVGADIMKLKAAVDVIQNQTYIRGSFVKRGTKVDG